MKIKYLCKQIFYANRQWFQGRWFAKHSVRIDGKVVIITGANCGIGKETALELAKRGGRIYLACRSFEKAEAARLKIVKESGNLNVFTRWLDLSSFASIRQFVEE